jgi:hypothetical protein
MLARALRELRSVNDEFRSTLQTHLEIDEPVVSPNPVQPEPSMTSASIAREPVAAETLQPPVSESVDDEVSTPYVA